MRYISCVVLAALSMFAVSEQFKWSCKNIFLTNDKNCHCSDLLTGAMEITCPNIKIKFSGSLPHHVIITCNSVLLYPTPVPTFRVSSVSIVQLDNCLSTAITMREIMDHLGINNIKRMLSIEGKMDSLAKGQLANLTKEVRLDELGLKYIYQDIFVDQNTTESDIRTLYLRSNNISQLDDTVFTKLKQLKDLNLSDNQLTTLPDDLFVNNKNLRDLNLSYNKLQSISSKLLRNQEKLISLDISYNQLKHLKGEWRGLGSLTFLFLKYNQLTNMGDGMESVLKNVGHLRRLSLISNNLTRVYPDWFKGLKFIELGKNNFQTVKINSLFNETFKVYLDLSENNITEIDVDALQSFNGQLKLYLSMNPLICNCNLHSLVELTRKSEEGSLSTMDSDYITCGSPASLKGRLVKDLTMEELKCPVSEGGRDT